MEKKEEFKTNVSSLIKSLLGKNLHNQKNHPLNLLKTLIFNYFDDLKMGFQKFDTLSPIVDVKHNFDDLLIPESHPSRRLSDSYYIDQKTVLRTHTTAHLSQLLSSGINQYLIVGDVYRKDDINSHHYPVFHQLEGAYVIFDEKVDPEKHLKETLTGLIEYLFPNCEYRFNKDYFPFTTPSFEVEVKFHGKWLEILGCGVVHKDIMSNSKSNKSAWAFGMGLERLAMIYFDIPDIRLFWTSDTRFIDQFTDLKLENIKTFKFKPYPTLKPVAKDISFYIPEVEIKVGEDKTFEWTKMNDFNEIVREVCGDCIESVNVLDKFYNSKTKKYSIAVSLSISPAGEFFNLQDGAQLIQKANEFIRTIAEKLNKLGYKQK